MIKKMYFGLHVKYLLFLSDLNETSRNKFEKQSNTKSYENPSSGSRSVPCGRRTEGRTGMTKLSRFSQILRTRQKGHHNHLFNLILYGSII